MLIIKLINNKRNTKAKARKVEGKLMQAKSLALSLPIESESREY